tara:strand:+ start:551 stop:769 length:219 start_codon:yes stop_codon:yes gene_type:complete
MLNNKKWLHEIGELVHHESHGSGIITNRHTMSFYEEARPIRIVDKEMYLVCFGSSESNISVLGKDLIKDSQA